MARIETDPNYNSPTFSRATAPTDIFKKEDIQNVASAFSTHIHDGAGKGLGITTLPSGIVTSAMIANGTIQDVDIAPGAVSQRRFVNGSTLNPTTTSTSYVDLTDLSITLTTGGGDLLVWAVASVYNSGAGNFIFLALSLDGASEVGEMVVVPSGAGGASILVGSLVYAFSGPSSASHTVKVRWKTLAGTATGNALNRYLMVMEMKR
jgi:hypothetical protein